MFLVSYLVSLLFLFSLSFFGGLPVKVFFHVVPTLLCVCDFLLPRRRTCYDRHRTHMDHHHHHRLYINTTHSIYTHSSGWPTPHQFVDRCGARACHLRVCGRRPCARVITSTTRLGTLSSLSSLCAQKLLLFLTTRNESK